MANILILYSTTDGHTIKICNRLRQVSELQGNRVTVLPICEAEARSLPEFDAIVIGASIRYGKHKQEVADFATRHARLLDSKPNAFFSVNIVARKPNRNTPETNPYLRKFLRQIDWHPKTLAVFAGKLDYPRYRFFDRLMIRFIMLLTKGPTDPKAVIEFTDWEQVEAFGRRIGDLQAH